MTDQSAVPTAKGRVVVGVDGSGASLRALDRAADEAERRGAELEILCGGLWPRRAAVPVTQSDTERFLKAAAEIVDEAVQRVAERAPGLRVVPSTPVETPAADALVRASRTAALTVVGTRGRGGFAGLLLGSVSLRVAAHCEGPLMVVRADTPDGTAPRGTTMVGLGSEADKEALRFGFEEATRRESTLRVLHVWPSPRMPGRLQLPPREVEEQRAAALAVVREAVAPFRERYPQVRVKEEEQTGAPAGPLIEASRAADVLVLSTHARQRRRLGLQLGPAAHAVLHHAHCPVVLVPAQ
ncbi:universal stress protein [Streptomyces daliensis]|uniref:Universal stress protein n=1 Tax=Streptomyces daliensis TaxID=299421 RepID=A0A8T4IQZ6_9ACTN|nr:universal stress protein [Streptomyces daliensis]